MERIGIGVNFKKGGAEERLLEKTNKRIKDSLCPAGAQRRREKTKEK